MFAAGRHFSPFLVLWQPDRTGLNAKVSMEVIWTSLWHQNCHIKTTSSRLVWLSPNLEVSSLKGKSHLPRIATKVRFTSAEQL